MDTEPSGHPTTARVVIVGTIEVRPEGRPRFDTVMTVLAAGTRTEPGCVGFSWGATADDGTGVLVQEEYLDEDALAHHQRQSYVAGYAEVLPDLLARPVTFRIHQASGMRPFTVAPAAGGAA